jgi:hypothetical protein
MDVFAVMKTSNVFIPEGTKCSKLHHFIFSDLVDIRFYNRKDNSGTFCTLPAILPICTFHNTSHGSSGSIVSDYGLDDRSSIPDRGRGFFF